VLVLDEPTNDLDIETLELLESLLQDYRGTIFLVSHDRAFLDNVVTKVIAFEGDGVLREYAGGYTDWAEYQARHGDARQRAAMAAGGSDSPRAAPGKPASTPAAATAVRGPGRPRRNRLSFNDERELAGLPARIEGLEARIGELRSRLADVALYREAAQDIRGLHAELAQLEADVAASYARWEALEAHP